MPPILHNNLYDCESIGITDNLLCFISGICESLFSFLICSSVTGVGNVLIACTSTATNFFDLSVGSK